MTTAYPEAAARRGAGALALAAGAAASLTAAAYWPGLMTWDPVRQYGEALTGAFDDWHPPAMAWLWRQLIPVHAGPLPMLVLQLLLYWTGIATVATAAWRRGRGGAWALLLCGLWPPALALTGAILKDCLMTGALLVAVGALALADDRRSAPLRVLGIVSLIAAATLRFNAFTAGVPLFVALLPPAWRSGWARLAGASLVATVLLLAAVPLSGRLIGVERSGVELSLVIFDLGGITEEAGVSVFPDEIEVRDPVAVNHRCYTPNKWDSYSDWVEPECPLGFTAWNDNVDPQDVRPYPFWARAVLAHPFAYAAHRLHHFAIATRLLPLTDAVERPVPNRSAPNPWGFHVADNPLLHAIDSLALATAHTPLGWPIVFIALALGTLLASRGVSGAGPITPVALSALLFGCGYLVFGVAPELRYQLWTVIGALLAAVMLVSAPGGRDRRRLICALAPPALAAAAGLAARVL